MSDVLGIFAKWPRPGAVKTRLGLPPEHAAAVARAFLLDTLARLAPLPVRRVVVFSPRDAQEDFAALLPTGFDLVAQADGDLGARLEAFFACALASGAQRVVAVGTDSPTLPPEHVAQAFRLVEDADVVLGPAGDGGYYLIGCRRLPPVFAGIAWSSATVLAETVARLDDPAWRLALLPPWYDVDTPADWEMLREHVAALRRAGINPGVPETEALLRRLP
jgi:rSAM/selenodomain-associated transferase 1